MEEGKRARLDSAAHNQSQIIVNNIRHLLQTPDLPIEIIQDILIKLPVKSLSRFKCASKSWLSMISCPQFVKTHLKLSAENADYAFHRIILTVKTPHFELKQCSVSSLISQPQIAATELDYPRRSPDTAVLVVGCCNGIVCIVIDEKDVFLWNPSTGKTKELPSPSVELKPGFYSLWGFGYVESDDDYKVVGIYCTYVDDDDVGVIMEESVVKMYSLSANSWKSIGPFSGGGIPIVGNGKLANGKLHFSTTPEMDPDEAPDNNFCWDIVSIDLKSEGYATVEQPNYGVGCRPDATLGVLGGCLTVICDDDERQRVDVWIMKEYGVKESWTRLVSIPNFLHDPEQHLDPCSYPLLIMPNGEFLVMLLFKVYLAAYNPKEDRVRRVEMSNLQTFYQAHIYFESLVPL